MLDTFLGGAVVGTVCGQFLALLVMAFIYSRSAKSRAPEDAGEAEARRALAEFVRAVRGCHPDALPEAAVHAGLREVQRTMGWATTAAASRVHGAGAR